MHTKDELHAYTIVFWLKNWHYYFKNGKFIDSDAAKKLWVSLLDDAWIDCKWHNELPAMIRSKDVCEVFVQWER